MAFSDFFSGLWLVQRGSKKFLVFIYSSSYKCLSNKRKIEKIHQHSEAHDFFENGMYQNHPQGCTGGPKKILFADSYFLGLGLQTTKK